MKSTRDLILEKYLRVCKAAAEDDEVFRTFKSHPHYHEVLEHCPKKIGQAHLDNIRKYNPELLAVNAFWANDEFGNPPIADYGHIKASPTTLQYISVLSNLIERFGSLRHFSICEIGAGYLGQAKIIKDYFEISQYDTVDLYECTLLQNRYAYIFRMENVRTYTNENYANMNYPLATVKDFDLVISNYALTEVSAEDQLKYVKDICLNSKRGYITANQPLNGIELLHRKFRDLKIEPDIKGERESNFLITWG